MSDLFRAIFSNAAANASWTVSWAWPQTAAGRLGLGALLAAAAVAGVVSGWRVGRHRRAVVALRLAALAVLGLILARPALDFVETERLRNVVAVLLDDSLSMTAKVNAGERRRADLVRDFLVANRDAFDRVRQEADIEVLRFGRETHPTTLEAAAHYEPRADATRLLPAVRELQRFGRGAPGQAERPLAGVILLSDGGVNDAALSPAKAKAQALVEAKRLGCPWVCVAAGRTKGFKDIAVRVLKHDAFAFVRNAWTVEVGVRVRGYSAMRLPVTLWQGRRLITTQVIRVSGGDREYRLTMRFAPRRPGHTAFTISAPVQADERVVENNAARVGVRVVRDKIRVLHVCGRPSWDVRFLRRFLKQTPNIDLISFFILRNMGDTPNAPQNDLSLIRFPTDELFTRELSGFDIVIFQNFDYRPYDVGRLEFLTYLRNLRDYVVSDGGAFVMVGGDLAFSQGGYAKSPLADVLPVAMDRERDRVDDSDFRPVLTRAGRVHPVTQLSFDPDDNVALWASLPKLQGCNVTQGLRPGAVALATHPRLSANGQPAPIIAACEPGAGRVLAIMADTTWHWNFLAAGQRGSNRHYLRFWRNAIQWLIRSHDLQHVRVRPSVDAVPPGGRVRATVTAVDRNYEPDAGRAVQLNVVNLDNNKTVLTKTLTTDAKGAASAEFQAATPGVYEIRAAYGGADAMRKDTAQIICQYAGEELADAAPDEAWLRDLAKATDGWFVELPEGKLDLDKLKIKPVERIIGRRSFPLWDNLVALSVLVGLLCGEWWLRRRSA